MKKNDFNKRTIGVYVRMAKRVPEALMVSHWTMLALCYSDGMCVGKGIAVDAMYFMAYAFPIVIFLPMSYLLGLCWIRRIPFSYLVMTNVIHIAFGSPIPMDEMMPYFLLLIVATIVVYAYALLRRTL